ncbi:exopolysaccharide biosynthesis protein [Wolbachia endosymbiont of Pentidionis agamae]|uniref:exopolysaccharide biosynthesis protein n=1 Tax=Wolbachia endosymbiont of Pentidionis agamae TaxID=3110435 RepID=UPI002FCECE22
MQKNNKPASSLLEEVANIKSSDRVTLFEIKAALHERGFGILIIIFSLPLSVPLPVPPGYTTILSIPLLLFSLQILLGFDSPWMPRWLEQKSFQRSTLALIIEKTSPILKKVEKFMRPRMVFIFCRLGEKILAFIMLLSAFSIAIPLPLTNFIPAIGITFIALSIMSRDGVFSMLGILISLFGLFITAVILIVGPKLVLEFFFFLKNIIFIK